MFIGLFGFSSIYLIYRREARHAVTPNAFRIGMADVSCMRELLLLTAIDGSDDTIKCAKTDIMFYYSSVIRSVFRIGANDISCMREE